MTQLRFGIEVGVFTWPGGAVAIPSRLQRIATAIEGRGLDSMWLWDHFAQWSRQWDEPFLEAWTTMGYLAAVTERISLGVLVSGVTHRHPAVLVKQASTLDVLAGGRTYFGIGAGWNQREHEAFGIPFPELPERFALLEDTARIAKRAWSGEVGSFEGSRVRLAEHVDSPLPIRRPHPPILIGGGGERKTLRLVARYADAANFGKDPEEFRRKMTALREHCLDIGRDFERIELTATVQVPPEEERTATGAETFAEYLGEFVALGARHVILGVPDGRYEEAIDWLADHVLDEVRRQQSERSAR